MAVQSRARKRPRGEIETLPSGSLRVRVYAGIDPFTGKRHHLVETIPAGPDAAREAEKARVRLLSQVDERRNPRTKATVSQLLDRWPAPARRCRAPPMPEPRSPAARRRSCSQPAVVLAALLGVPHRLLRAARPVRDGSAARVATPGGRCGRRSRRTNTPPRAQYATELSRRIAAYQATAIRHPR
jgi:hypothetical protein